MGLPLYCTGGYLTLVLYIRFSPTRPGGLIFDDQNSAGWVHFSLSKTDIVYNLVRPIKTLRLEITDDPQRRWLPRTPAMAAGLTDHIWTVKELLITVPLPVGNT